MNSLKSCPSCGNSDVKDAYVYIWCQKCGLRGPWSNEGRNDDHADYIDHEHAVEAWNVLPRSK